MATKAAAAVAATAATVAMATATSSHRSPAIAIERFHTLPRGSNSKERYISAVNSHSILPAAVHMCRVFAGEKVNLTLTGAHASRVPCDALHK